MTRFKNGDMILSGGIRYVVRHQMPTGDECVAEDATGKLVRLRNDSMLPLDSDDRSFRVGDKVRYFGDGSGREARIGYVHQGSLAPYLLEFWDQEIPVKLAWASPDSLRAVDDYRVTVRSRDGSWKGAVHRDHAIMLINMKLKIPAKKVAELLDNGTIFCVDGCDLHRPKT